MIILLVLGVIMAGNYTGIISYGPQPAERARIIYLAMFTYAHDHEGRFPTGKSSTEVFQKLLKHEYIDDPAVFYYPLPGKVKPTSKELKPENVSWDVTVEVKENEDNPVPLVFLTGYKIKYDSGESAVPLKPENGALGGLPVAYQDGSTRFMIDDSQPDHVVPHFVPKEFNPGGKEYVQLTPDGALKP